jgi:preprotein translocase subunit SecG
VFLVTTLGLAYFGNLRSATPSAGSVLETTTVPATPAQQIPGSAPASGVAPAAPAAPATGADAIPAK